MALIARNLTTTQISIPPSNPQIILPPGSPGPFVDVTSELNQLSGLEWGEIQTLKTGNTIEIRWTIVEEYPTSGATPDLPGIVGTATVSFVATKPFLIFNPTITGLDSYEVYGPPIDVLVPSGCNTAVWSISPPYTGAQGLEGDTAILTSPGNEVVSVTIGKLFNLGIALGYTSDGQEGMIGLKVTPGSVLSFTPIWAANIAQALNSWNALFVVTFLNLLPLSDGGEKNGGKNGGKDGGKEK